MTELPSGTVTFLFSDIEGSTRLVERLGDRYVEVLAEHQLLRSAFTRFGGREVAPKATPSSLPSTRPARRWRRPWPDSSYWPSTPGRKL
jgi:class 3 adenylate cyclase